MHSDTILQGLDNLGQILSDKHEIQSNHESEFQFILELMDFSTQDSYQDDDHRIWNNLQTIINQCQYQNNIIWVRLYRGVLVLIRNVIRFETSDDELVSFVLTNLINFITNISSDNPFYDKTITIYFQILANIQDPILSKGSILSINNGVLSHLVLEKDYIHPLTHFLYNSFTSKEDNITSDGTYHNEQIYELLQINYDSNHIMNFFKTHFQDDINPLITNQSHHHEQIEFSQFQHNFITLLTEIITHESFGNWLLDDDLLSQENLASFSQWLKIGQLLITSKDNWNNYELIAIVSWIIKVFERFSQVCIDTITNNNDSESDNKELNELILIICLDIISDLGKFNQVTKMLIHYDILTSLIPLFRAVHDNIKPITLKTRARFEDLDNKETTFPQVKSLIIEIISYLTFENFEIQEKVRHLHGLELVLSNCIIDDNNPFIKERAIICLKYLLSQNAQNQKFVADLEAKGTNEVNEEIIDKAGYEVEIVDGKVQLKQKS
ncbi:spinocerebellar ataxia type 10 protein domain-containing protein [Scheffersomyces coipomensis]|uniref:spinocerebellar ataxia type 10 protein domain-containing protein n=1 Tax=Scheffersomyces coipomensis TaxID=1788519 RepID=UPI00315D2464